MPAEQPGKPDADRPSNAEHWASALIVVGIAWAIAAVLIVAFLTGTDLAR